MLDCRTRLGISKNTDACFHLLQLYWYGADLATAMFKTFQVVLNLQQSLGNFITFLQVVGGKKEPKMHFVLPWVLVDSIEKLPILLHEGTIEQSNTVSFIPLDLLHLSFPWLSPVTGKGVGRPLPAKLPPQPSWFLQAQVLNCVRILLLSLVITPLKWFSPSGGSPCPILPLKCSRVKYTPPFPPSTLIFKDNKRENAWRPLQGQHSKPLLRGMGEFLRKEAARALRVWGRDSLCRLQTWASTQVLLQTATWTWDTKLPWGSVPSWAGTPRCLPLTWTPHWHFHCEKQWLWKQSLDCESPDAFL